MNKPCETHVIAWQGWMIEVPAEWNPAQLGPDPRHGSILVADLERTRLELTWRSIRSVAAVDLSRIARRSTNQSLNWTVEDSRSEETGFSHAVRAIDRHEDSLFLAVASNSKRLLLARMKGGDHPSFNRLIVSLRDQPPDKGILWSVFDFTWRVPAGMRLTDHQFHAGRADATFRKRGTTITWTRRMPTERDAKTESEPDGSDEGQATHLGHDVKRHIHARRLQDRLLKQSRAEATWRCEHSQRNYRVFVAGRNAIGRLSEAVAGVACHRNVSG